MTRTARSRRLIGHADRPTVSIHPVTADKYGLENGSLAKVSSALGNADLFIDTDDTVNKDQLFAPIHWSAQFASRARVGAMLAPVTDPVSGQPEFKYTPVNIRALETPVWATIACRSALYHSGFIYWHRWPLLNGDGYFYLVAVEENHAWDELLPVAPGDEINNLAIARYSNPVKHDERIVCCSNQRLETVLFSHREREALPDMLWMQSLFDMVTVESSWALLKGNLSAAINDQVICACFQVKKTEIIEVVTAGTASPATLGEKLKCGTKCGSCLPELSQIIEAHHPEGARV